MINNYVETTLIMVDKKKIICTLKVTIELYVDLNSYNNIDVIIIIFLNTNIINI